MRREKIHIGNYESWFLDYMEGALNSAERLVVLDFVAQHPELRSELEQDFDTQLTLQPSSTGFSEKASLKKPDSDSLGELHELMISEVEGLLDPSQQAALNNAIAEHKLERVFSLYKATVLKPISVIPTQWVSDLKCAEYFTIDKKNADDQMIAASEGLLSPMESKIVSVWAQENQHAKSFERFVSAKLIADPTLRYAEKEKLKRRTGIVIPFYLKLAAAAAVVLLLAIPFLSEGDQRLVDSPVDVDGTPLVPMEPKIHTASAMNRTDRDSNKTNNYHIPLPEYKNDFVEKQIVSVDTAVNPSDKILNDLVPNDEIAMDTVPGVDRIEQPDFSDDVAEEVRSTVDSDKYRTDEPIQILTNFANSKFGTDIAFTRRKNLQKDEYVSYRVSFGRFEFERKKSH